MQSRVEKGENPPDECRKRRYDNGGSRDGECPRITAVRRAVVDNVHLSTKKIMNLDVGCKYWRIRKKDTSTCLGYRPTCGGWDVLCRQNGREDFEKLEEDVLADVALVVHVCVQ